MPYSKARRGGYRRSKTKTRTKTSYKKVYRKRRYHNYRRSKFSPNSFLSLDKYFCKLRFTDYQQITAAAGDSSECLQYSLNSVFDPYYGVGGGSVRGFAELAGIWDKYCVTGCKVTVQYARTDGPYPIRMYIQGWSWNDVASAAPTFEELCAQQTNAVSVMILPYHGDSVVMQRTPVLVKYFSIKKLEGHTITSDENYIADGAADPAYQSTVGIGLTKPIAYAANAVTLDVQVTLKYYVQFRDRIENL